MKITTTAGLVGFLLALSTINLSKAEATVQNSTNPSHSSIESRLGRIAKVIREKENEAEGSLDSNIEDLYIAGGFANKSGAGGFANGGGGFANKSGAGGFANKSGAGGFANGGGGFANKSGTGTFANKSGAGGFANGAGGFANKSGTGTFANR